MATSITTTDDCLSLPAITKDFNASFNSPAPQKDRLESRSVHHDRIEDSRTRANRRQHYSLLRRSDPWLRTQLNRTIETAPRRPKAYRDQDTEHAQADEEPMPPREPRTIRGSPGESDQFQQPLPLLRIAAGGVRLHANKSATGLPWSANLKGRPEGDITTRSCGRPSA